ncbi:MAG TPA: GNAT family N-acetyltransferase [Trueperaceae bacterium]|nr:GNAT family N-acetyltransferase [Trueperaceae bacterium]
MAAEPRSPSIRPSVPGDEAALYRICLLTGDSGGDATALYRDPQLIGHVYVGPYAALEPEHALVLADGDPANGVSDGDAGLCGYAVGALDTAAFNARVRESWLPPLRARYPDPAGDPAGWSRDQRLMRVLHHPDDAFPLTLEPRLAPYPSHVHIDLLPRAQGRGLGRSLLEALLARLRDDGSPGVHLGVGSRNLRAIGFYQHLGFARLFAAGEGGAVWMGKRLG